jgi:hypothetical protein
MVNGVGFAGFSGDSNASYARDLTPVPGASD